ncbi:MAG: LCP family protein [Bifidobacteriaceae bacterium]|jgi:LCP family protein required for cell wall assembly|nr:LCP family protein [Bifidobacteriaceae bacterium]
MPGRHRTAIGHHIGRHRQKVRHFTVLRRVGVVVVALVMAASSTAVAGLANLNSSLKSEDVTKLLGTDRPTDEAPTVKSNDPTDPFGGRALNILVLGSDSRQGDNSDYVHDQNPGLRSDVAMIFHISADRSRVNVVSIPRDTTVTIPPCTLSNGKTTGLNWTTKFNAAFSRGGVNNDIGDAAACTIHTIETNWKLRIDEYIVVDFAGFANMVNALGYVEMCIPNDMTSQKAHLNIKAGWHKIKGTQALALARARTGTGLGDGSDIDRLDRQHQMLYAIVQRVLGLNMFTNLPALYQFLGATLKTMTVSPDLGSVQKMAGLALSLRNVNSENIHAITMPWVSDPNITANVELAPQAAKVWKALKRDTPLPNSVLPADQRTASPTPAVPAPGDASASDMVASADAAATAAESGTASTAPATTVGGGTSDVASPSASATGMPSTGITSEKACKAYIRTHNQTEDS